ncbi:MAG: hypothetical protein J0H99_27855, partial [Rhodospirillales bacterium]|nr:hypothetical protein [Rhodospirillales bacterium]
MNSAIENVLHLVAERFGVSVADIKSQRRSRYVVPARLVVTYLAHTVLGMAPRLFFEPGYTRVHRYMCAR